MVSPGSLPALLQSARRVRRRGRRSAWEMMASRAAASSLPAEVPCSALFTRPRIPANPTINMNSLPRYMTIHINHSFHTHAACHATTDMSPPLRIDHVPPSSQTYLHPNIPPSYMFLHNTIPSPSPPLIPSGVPGAFKRGRSASRARDRTSTLCATTTSSRSGLRFCKSHKNSSSIHPRPRHPRSTRRRSAAHPPQRPQPRCDIRCLPPPCVRQCTSYATAIRSFWASFSFHRATSIVPMSYLVGSVILSFPKVIPNPLLVHNSAPGECKSLTSISCPSQPISLPTLILCQRRTGNAGFLLTWTPRTEHDRC